MNKDDLWDALGMFIISIGIMWFLGMFFAPPATYALFMDESLRDGWIFNQWTFLVMSIILWIPPLYFLFKPETREQKIKRLKETVQRTRKYRFINLDISNIYYKAKKELEQILSSDELTNKDAIYYYECKLCGDILQRNKKTKYSMCDKSGYKKVKLKRISAKKFFRRDIQCKD